MAAPVIGRRPGWALSPTTVVDRQHPLALGLATFAVPSLAMDLATGNPLTLVGGTNHSAGGTPWGPGETNFSSTIYWKIGNGPVIGNQSTFSVVSGFRMSSTGVANGRAVYCERAASGLDIAKCDSTASAWTGKIGYTWRDDAGTLLSTGGATSIFSANVIAAWVRTSNTVFDLWLNGNREATATAAGMTANFTNANIERRIGSDAQDSLSVFGDGIVSFVACYTRALSAGEIAQLAADPFCMLRY